MPQTFPCFKVLLLGLIVASLPAVLLSNSTTAFKQAFNRLLTPLRTSRISTGLLNSLIDPTPKRDLANVTMGRTPVYFLSHGGPK